MTILKLNTASERNAGTAASAAGSAGSVPASLTYGDFTGEYRAVLDELIASRLGRYGLTGADSANNVMTQALMRVVYVGQQQRTPVERLREMVTDPGRKRRDHRDWKPQVAFERQAGMLAGSPRLRRIG
ncbi:hypothetical protein [Pantoea ananatis]|uniref:hypothetical protein n=1 Tax=Pantoea ananas TaxID=553 RepID=UPI001C8A386F|nr:hypothetical protein [Pantoea ananatis]QZE31410.1 hypothetical protein K4732_20870 [Pantoea ananatis]